MPTRDEIERAIERLQNKIKEPCDWCAEFDDREYTTRGWTWKELKPMYCPNCGRKLVKHNG